MAGAIHNTKSEREAIVANHPSRTHGVPSGVSKRWAMRRGGTWCKESGVGLRDINIMHDVCVFLAVSWPDLV